MKYVVFRNGFADEADVCETLADAQSILQERYDDDPHYFEVHEYNVHEIGNKLPISFTPQTLVVGSITEIPAPLPGESVTDYAARITAR